MAQIPKKMHLRKRTVTIERLLGRPQLLASSGRDTAKTILSKSLEWVGHQWYKTEST